jgi:hypothetical protein
MSQLTSKAIGAENTFTDAVRLGGNFNISIQGTFSATVFVQRSYDNSNWYDVDSFTSATEQTGFEPEYIWYRLGVKTGGYTSGTANVRIGQADANLTRN